MNESAGEKLWKRRAQTALGNRRSDFHFSHSFNNNKLDDRNHFLQNAKTSVASLRRLITPTRNADHDQPGTLIIFIGIRIQEKLQQEMDSKVIQRQKQQHLPTYHLLRDTCKARTVGGHVARSCIAEFTSELGTPMAEYLTLVRSQNALALFFGFIPANDLDSYQKRLDPIIETLQLP